MSERYFAIINPSNLITSVVLMDASSEEEGIQKVKDSHNNQNLNIKENASKSFGENLSDKI